MGQAELLHIGLEATLLKGLLQDREGRHVIAGIHVRDV